MDRRTSKEKFRELLAEYIATERPKFLKQISYEDMRKNIIDLSKFDTQRYVHLKNRLKRKYLKSMMIMNMLLTSMPRIN